VTRYAAFLRGINLGPTNKIAMPLLRQLAEDLGYDDVATYLNSGNLVVTSTRESSTLAHEISAALEPHLGKTIDVAVRSQAELEQVLAADPYPAGDRSKVTVAFLTGPPAPDAQERLARVAAVYEPFVLAGTEVYVHYGQGLGTSKLAQQFSRIIGVSATVRTIRTVEKVFALLRG
jgi:uncharacterized protein (DUF1697 family)